MRVERGEERKETNLYKDTAAAAFREWSFFQKCVYLGCDNDLIYADYVIHSYLQSFTLLLNSSFKKAAIKNPNA